MRRILHIIDSLDYTGTASQLLVLGKGLVARGGEVHVCALNRHAPRFDEFQAAQVSTTIVPRRWTIDPLADWQLVRHIRRLQPDIVHSWDSLPGTCATVVAGRRLIVGHYRITRWNPGWKWAIERHCGRRAERYVTDCASVREWCSLHGLPADKFEMIPSSVETARPSDLSRAALLSELGLPANARLIGVIGQLIPDKRVRDLIWAADLLRVLHDSLRLLVIGDGPLRSQLEEYARSASDLDHIRFLGEGNDVWRIMPHLDVLWNGSEDVGQSTTILEAMAAGVPVIASDTASNRELVVEDETGFLIPLGTRAGRAARARNTDRIFVDGEFAAKLSNAARLRAKELFGAEQMVSAYFSLYK